MIPGGDVVDPRCPCRLLGEAVKAGQAAHRLPRRAFRFVLKNANQTLKTSKTSKTPKTVKNVKKRKKRQVHHSELLHEVFCYTSTRGAVRVAHPATYFIECSRSGVR